MIDSNIYLRESLYILIKIEIRIQYNYRINNSEIDVNFLARVENKKARKKIKRIEFIDTFLFLQKIYIIVETLIKQLKLV